MPRKPPSSPRANSGRMPNTARTSNTVAAHSPNVSAPSRNMSGVGSRWSGHARAITARETQSAEKNEYTSSEPKTAKSVTCRQWRWRRIMSSWSSRTTPMTMSAAVHSTTSAHIDAGRCTETQTPATSRRR